MFAYKVKCMAGGNRSGIINRFWWVIAARNGKVLATSKTLYKTPQACNKTADKIAKQLGLKLQKGKVT